MPASVSILLAIITIGLLVFIAVAMKLRLDIEKRVVTSITRVENILAGTASKGSAGENIVELALSKLPTEWLIRNKVINNRPVEFAVRLPDTLILPIDHKWPATDLLEQFLECGDTDQKTKLKTKIQVTTRDRALEVRKYLDPTVTTSFGIAVVPEPIFELCVEIIPALFQQNVMLVSHSMLLPYILLIVHMTIKASRTNDLRRLDTFVREATQSVDNLQKAIQGRFSSATTLLENFRSELAAELTKLKTSLAVLEGLGAASPIEATKPDAKLEAGA